VLALNIQKIRFLFMMVAVVNNRDQSKQGTYEKGWLASTGSHQLETCSKSLIRLIDKAQIFKFPFSN